MCSYPCFLLSPRNFCSQMLLLPITHVSDKIQFRWPWQPIPLYLGSFAENGVRMSELIGDKPDATASGPWGPSFLLDYLHDQGDSTVTQSHKCSLAALINTWAISRQPPWAAALTIICRPPTPGLGLGQWEGGEGIHSATSLVLKFPTLQAMNSIALLHCIMVR